MVTREQALQVGNMHFEVKADKQGKKQSEGRYKGWLAFRPISYQEACPQAGALSLSVAKLICDVPLKLEAVLYMLWFNFILGAVWHFPLFYTHSFCQCRTTKSSIETNG